MSRRAGLIELTYQLFSIVKLYSRQQGHGLYIPFDMEGEEVFISHSDDDLIKDVLGGGFVVGNAETGEFNLFEGIEDIILHFINLTDEEFQLLQERIDIAIDTFLAFNAHRNLQTEELLEDIGRSERILEVREGLEQFYLKNKKRLNLPPDFLHKHAAVPEPEEEKVELMVVDEEEDGDV